jgi:hypothetical protein
MASESPFGRIFPGELLEVRTRSSSSGFVSRAGRIVLLDFMELLEMSAHLSLGPKVLMPRCATSVPICRILGSNLSSDGMVNC